MSKLRLKKDEKTGCIIVCAVILYIDMVCRNSDCFKKTWILWVDMPKGLQAICTLSPGLVAILLTGIFFRKHGLKSLLNAVVKWRVKLNWYLFILVVGVALVGLSLFLFDWAWGQSVKSDQAYNFVFYFILILPLSALWEEVGWRGFLLPNLQEKYSPLKSSLIIGLVWGIWHLPIYLAIDPYCDKTIVYFLLMFVGCFALSIIQTWIYNATAGSVLICIRFHNAINTSAAYFYGNLKGAELRPLFFLVGFLVWTAIWICLRTKGNLTERKQRPLTFRDKQTPEFGGVQHPIKAVRGVKL